MRVLAFDPGYERLGVAVLQKEGGKEVLVYSDCVRTSAGMPFADRLAALGKEAKRLIKEFEPEAVAIEEIFFEKNAKTATQVAQVAGVLSFIASEAGLPLHAYTPLEVKVAVTGYGRGDKAAVAAMVPRLVVLPPGKRLDDELDAIAVGLTCLASARFGV